MTKIAKKLWLQFKVYKNRTIAVEEIQKIKDIPQDTVDNIVSFI